MSSSSPYPGGLAPRYKVTIGGTTFDEYDAVTDVVADTTTDGADHCSVTLTSPFDHEQGDFEDLTWSEFTIGKPLTIEMGHGEGSSAVTKVFTGSIETVEPEFEPDAPPRVTLTGYSPMRTLMKGSNSKSWKQKSLKKIVQAVAGSTFDSKTIESASMTLKRVFQDDQSDYRFLMHLANKYGFEFFDSLGDAYFRPKTGGSSPGKPVTTLYYGESLQAFSAKMQPPDHAEVEVRHWNETDEKTIKGSASNQDGTGKQVYRVPVGSKSEADKIAKAKLEETKVTATGETFGVPQIVAGKVIKLKGVSAKFTNNYYVTRATHRAGGAGYRTSFEATQLSG
jgi:phage protein D